MRKVKHAFVYQPPNLYSDFKHSISFRISWRGKDYGQFMLFSDSEWECPYYCLRQLLREKHLLVEDMDYVDENETL